MKWKKMFETTSPYMYVYLHDDFTINDSKENKKLYLLY